MKIKSLLLAVVSCGLLAPVSLAQKRLDFPTHKKHVSYTAPAKAVAVVPEKPPMPGQHVTVAEWSGV